MSYASAVEEEFLLRRRHEYEEETFDQILTLLAEKYQAGDYRVQEYLGMRRSTIEMIEKDGTWKHDKDGFTNRSDFEYKEHQITYQTNHIGKVDGVYVPAGLETEKAKKFYYKNIKFFELLGKIEAVIDGFYEEHKKEANTVFEYCTNNRKLKDSIAPIFVEKLRPLSQAMKPEEREARFREKVIWGTSQIASSFNKYGGLLINRVVTILNELEEVEDLKAYVDEFVKTYSKLVTILEPNEYNRILSDYQRIPYIIMSIVERYSVRGRLFAKMAKQEFRKLEGQFSFETERPEEEVPTTPQGPKV